MSMRQPACVVLERILRPYAQRGGRGMFDQCIDRMPSCWNPRFRDHGSAALLSGSSERESGLAWEPARRVAMPAPGALDDGG